MELQDSKTNLPPELMEQQPEKSFSGSHLGIQQAGYGAGGAQQEPE